MYLLNVYHIYIYIRVSQELYTILLHFSLGELHGELLTSAYEVLFKVLVNLTVKKKILTPNFNHFLHCRLLCCL